MSVVVSYKGTENVCRYIESTKRVYFAIFPSISKTAKPVFRNTDKKNVAGAVELFRNWADIIISGDPNHDAIYILRLYESSGDDDMMQDGETVRIGAGRNTFEVYFTLTANSQAPQQVQPMGVSNHGYVNEIIEARVDNEKLRAKIEQMELENKLNRRIDALEAELRESEDGEDDNGGIGAIGEQLLGALLPLITGANLQQQMRPTMAGINSATASAISPQLEQTIVRLKNADPKLEQDLELLANLAETNPGQFQFLLNALRQMK